MLNGLLAKKEKLALSRKLRGAGASQHRIQTFLQWFIVTCQGVFRLLFEMLPHADEWHARKIVQLLYLIQPLATARAPHRHWTICQLLVSYDQQIATDLCPSAYRTRNTSLRNQQCLHQWQTASNRHRWNRTTPDERPDARQRLIYQKDTTLQGILRT